MLLRPRTWLARSERQAFRPVAAENSANRRCVKKRLAERLVRRERMRHAEDMRFGTGTMGFGCIVVLQVRAQIPGGGFGSPSHDGNLNIRQDSKRAALLPFAIAVLIAGGIGQ